MTYHRFHKESAVYKIIPGEKKAKEKRVRKKPKKNIPRSSAPKRQTQKKTVRTRKSLKQRVFKKFQK